LCNAFSLSMIQKTPAAIGVWEVSLEQVKKLLSNGFTSAVGHPSTAQLLTKLLGVNVPVNRVQVKLDDNTILVVFQLLARLPEGKILTEEELKQLPHKWFIVTALTVQFDGSSAVQIPTPDVYQLLRQIGIKAFM